MKEVMILQRDDGLETLKDKLLKFFNILVLGKKKLKRAASNLEDRKELQGAVQNKRLIGRRDENKEVILGKKVSELL